MSITRLRSDKGSFVRSPLGSFDSVEEAVLSFTVECNQNLEGTWQTPTQSPCNWDFTASGSGDWLAGFALLVDGVRSPTILEYENIIVGSNWVGDTSGVPLTFVAGAFYCDNPFPWRIWRPGDDGVDGVIFVDTGASAGSLSYAYVGQVSPAWVVGETFSQT